MLGVVEHISERCGPTAKISLLDGKTVRNLAGFILVNCLALQFSITSIFGKKVTHSEKLFLVVKLSSYKLLFSTKEMSSLPSLPIFWRCVVSVSVVSGVGDRSGTEKLKHLGS